MMDKSIVDKTFNKHTNYQEAESINSKAKKRGTIQLYGVVNQYECF